MGFFYAIRIEKIIVVSCFKKQGAEPHKDDTLWAEFDRLYHATNGQFIKASAEDFARYEYSVRESDNEHYDDTVELCKKMCACDSTNWGYDYHACIDEEVVGDKIEE